MKVNTLIEAPGAGLATGNAHWAAVFSLLMGVTSLVASEFIPVSLLTPIAEEFGITDGMAGQSVTVVGTFAVLTSLLLAPLTGKIDRRNILLFFSILLVASNLLVAVSPSYPVMLIGRAMFGICVGGFWSMASVVTMQLVPPKDVPRALSIVFAGISVATIAALPLASYLGHLIGWRNVFHLGTATGLAAFFWQFFSLPSMPPQANNNFRNMFAMLKEPWILAGMTAILFCHFGHHVFFTYLRPFLQIDLRLTPQTLSSVLLAFGIFNCLGTVIAGFVLSKYFKNILLSIHVVLVALAVCLFLAHGVISVDIAVVILWGLVFGFFPVAWSTWITRTLPERAEIAGGIYVASIQSSIALAGGVGGMVYDFIGINGIFISSAFIQSLAVMLTMTSLALFFKAKGYSA